MRPQEIDYDSDAENDPLWLRQKTVNVSLVLIQYVTLGVIYVNTNCLTPSSRFIIFCWGVVKHSIIDSIHGMYIS